MIRSTELQLSAALDEASKRAAAEEKARASVAAAAEEQAETAAAAEEAETAAAAEAAPREMVAPARASNARERRRKGAEAHARASLCGGRRKQKPCGGAHTASEPALLEGDGTAKERQRDRWQ